MIFGFDMMCVYLQGDHGCVQRPPQHHPPVCHSPMGDLHLPLAQVVTHHVHLTLLHLGIRQYNQ